MSESKIDGVDEKTIEIVVNSGNHGGYQAVPSQGATPAHDIHARRSGSASILVRNDKGEVMVERKTSDIRIALKTRVSASSLPSIIPVAETPHQAPVIDANDVLERTGGKGASGAYREHLYPLDVLAEKFSTNINLSNPDKSRGLPAGKAADLLKEYGPNVLTPPPRLPLWMLFLLQFTNLLMVLLEITAILCIILFIVNPKVYDNLYLGLLLFIAIFVTCYETYSQEAKSDSLMEQFRAMVPEAAAVVRDGVLQPLPVSDLVIGDIVRLKSGDKVPADCRVIACSSMKVDQSMITGEAEPIDVEVTAQDPNALEAKNLIFNGSLVVDGSCMAVVVKTGDATLIGTMVELTGDVGKASSTLKADIEYFVKVVTIFALVQAALIFIVGLSQGYDPLQVFIYGFVVIMIGNVPQGLPTTVTACLFLVAQRMGKQNVFVKKLDIIETLGACTLICTDKTGTLTLNQMTVANLWIFGHQMTNDQFSEHMVNQVQSGNVDPITQVWYRLLMIATLNSRVVLQQTDANSTPAPSGDATELGLYRFFGSCLEKMFSKHATNIESFRSDNPKIHEIPFNSSFKWQMSIHNTATTVLGTRAAPVGGVPPEQILFLKGAPDVLLDKCGFYLAPDNVVKPIDEDFKRVYTTAYEEFGGQGERVLGFAMRPCTSASKRFETESSNDAKYADRLKENLIGKKEGCEPIRDLIFVGLITLLDPPRPEVPQAVRDCHTAHVKVVMVTGDHPLTAASIARKIGLITMPTRDVLAKERGIPKSEVPEEDIKAVVVHGNEINGMTEDDWKRLTSKQEIVFARTSPEQKLIIVKEFTKAGNITAMTGDGVNDSPALKQAAIGIAMGLNGSSVAKEAADVVLLDDNFASIVTGIREGRLLFANLRKSIAYTLAHLTPEVVPVLMWGFGGLSQPMGSMLALCIDLLTELVPATSFAFEEPEALIMQLPPRDPKKDRLTSFNLLGYAYFQAGLIITGGCYFYYFRAFHHFGFSSLQVVNNGNKHFPAANSDDIAIGDLNNRHFNEHEQQHVVQIIQAGWYLIIMIGQAIHIWNARTTTVSIFEHGLFRNKTANYGVVLAAILGCFVVYCPGIRYVVSASNPLSLEVFYASLIMFAVFWPFCEGRKWFTRNYPDHWLNYYFAW